MRIDEFITRLHKVKQTGERQYQACCPAHGDKEPSLSITEKDGRLLLKCFTGCTAQDIVRAMGLEMKDLFTEPYKKFTKWEQLREHIYQDERGNILAKKIIYKVDNGKQAVWYRYDKGQYVKGLNGLKMPLYRAADLLSCTDTVYIAEGEKDADTLVKMGLCGTTTPNGASGQWANIYNKYIKNKDVVILADNDDAGKEHTAKIAARLVNSYKIDIKSVKIINAVDILPTVKVKGDITDIVEEIGLETAKDRLLSTVLVAAEEIPSQVNIEFLLEDLPPELSKIGEGKYTVDEIGISYLFADIFKKKARFCAERACWYVYDGKHWTEDSGGLRVDELAKFYRKMLLISAGSIPDMQISHEITRFSQELCGRSVRVNLIKDARSVHPIYFMEFDKNPFLFNCQNGTFNLKTGEFKEHNADDLLSKLANVEYKPYAKCERWEQFIDEVMQGDKEKALFFQKALGYTLSGDVSLECFFLLYGATTRNGKGTAMNTYTKLMGDYGRTSKPEIIAVKYNNDSRNASEDIARLAGARFCNIPEPDKKLVLNTALVKSMTGGDTLNARFLHENSFDYIPQFKLFINTNYLPVVTDDSVFTSGRVKVIPFERHFNDNEQDKSLKEKLTTPESLSGVLNWCIRGFAKYLREGLEPPAVVLNATSQYQMKSDKIIQFIEECFTISYGYKTPGACAYEVYKQWCFRNGLHSLKSSNFFDELKSRNILITPVAKLNGKTYRNVVENYTVQNVTNEVYA